MPKKRKPGPVPAVPSPTPGPAPVPSPAYSRRPPEYTPERTHAIYLECVSGSGSLLCHASTIQVRADLHTGLSPVSHSGTIACICKLPKNHPDPYCICECGLYFRKIG